MRSGRYLPVSASVQVHLATTRPLLVIVGHCRSPFNGPQTAPTLPCPEVVPAGHGAVEMVALRLLASAGGWPAPTMTRPMIRAARAALITRAPSEATTAVRKAEPQKLEASTYHDEQQWGAKNADAPPAETSEARDFDNQRDSQGEFTH